jgi:hypothetical protein
VVKSATTASSQFPRHNAVRQVSSLANQDPTHADLLGMARIIKHSSHQYGDAPILYVHPDAGRQFYIAKTHRYRQADKGAEQIHMGNTSRDLSRQQHRPACSKLGGSHAEKDQSTCTSGRECVSKVGRHLVWKCKCHHATTLTASTLEDRMAGCVQWRRGSQVNQ